MKHGNIIQRQIKITLCKERHLYVKESSHNDYWITILLMSSTQNSYPCERGFQVIFACNTSVYQLIPSNRMLPEVERQNQTKWTEPRVCTCREPSYLSTVIYWITRWFSHSHTMTILTPTMTLPLILMGRSLLPTRWSKHLPFQLQVLHNSIFLPLWNYRVENQEQS